MGDLEVALKVMRAYISKHGLKYSRQRELIAEVFLRLEGHSTVENILSEVRSKDDKVSQATVYRTMKLLTDCLSLRPKSLIRGIKKVPIRTI